MIGHGMLLGDIRGRLDRHSRATPCRIVLSGPTGCGKSHVCTEWLVAQGYTPALIDASHYHTMAQVQTRIESFRSRSIDSFFQTEKPVVLFDDIDILSTNLPRLLGYLAEALPSLRFPVIATCSHRDEKRVLEGLQKGDTPLFTAIKMKRLSDSELFVILKQHPVAGQLETAKLYALIERHKRDLRAILQNVHMIRCGTVPLVSSCGGTDDFRVRYRQTPTAKAETPAPVDADDIQTLREDCHYSDMSMFDIQAKLLAKPYTLTDLASLLYSDNKLLAMNMYDNVVTELQSYRAVAQANPAKDLRRLYRAYADVGHLEEYIHKTIAYELQPYVNVATLGTLGHVLQRYTRKSTAAGTYAFTSMMNRASLRFQFLKRRQAFQETRGVDTEDIFFAASVIGRWMARTTGPAARASIVDGVFTKDDLDVATKYVQDTGIITAAGISSWRKKLRTVAGKADEAAA